MFGISSKNRTDNKQHLAGNSAIATIEIGRTMTRIGLFDFHDKLLQFEGFATDATLDATAMITGIVIKIGQMAAEKKVVIKNVGVSFAGLVDNEQGIILSAGKFHRSFNGFKIKAALEKNMSSRSFKIKVAVDNDAKCFLAGEHRYGAVKQYKHVLGVTLGSGIGTAFLCDGKLYRGRNNITEGGHMILENSNLQCSLGHSGDWEAFSSGEGISNIYYHMTGDNIPSFDVIKKARIKKDPKAREAIRECGEHLAIGFVNMILILNPDAVVVGGGFSEVKELGPIVLKEIDKRLSFKKNVETKIFQTQLGNKAGLYGAMLLTKEVPFDFAQGKSKMGN